MSSGGAQHKKFGPYFDRSGNLYPRIQVFHYDAGTSNPKTVWTDEGKVSAAADPVVGNASGICHLYGDGDYKFVVKDENGADLEDPESMDNVKLSSDTATMWEGNQGTVLPSASAINKGQMFLLVDGSSNYLSLHINADGSTWETILTKDSSGDYTIFDDVIAGGPIVDLRYYLPDGFVIDGSVDYATEIRNAITALAGTAGVGGDAQKGVGGTVLFPSGVWRIESAITVTSAARNQNITLLGMGTIATVIDNQNAAGANAVEVDGDGGDLNYGFTIRNMSIWGNAASGHGVSISNGVKQITLDRVDLSTHGADGLAIQDSSANISLINCRMRSNLANGVSIASGSLSVTLLSTELKANAVGLALGSDIHGVSVNGCYFDGNITGVNIAGTDAPAGVVSSCIIQCNNFYNNGQDIICTNAGATYFSEAVNILGNTFDATSGTDAVDGGGSGIAGTVGSVNFLRADNCILEGNEFRNIVSANVDYCLVLGSASTNNKIGLNYYAASVTISKLQNAGVLADGNYGYVSTDDLTLYVANKGALRMNRGICLGDASVKTISGGVLDITGSWHKVTGESVPDDLNSITIDGSAPGPEHEGWIIVLTNTNNSQQVTVKDAFGGAGGIECAGDFVMDNAVDTMVLMYRHDNTTWLELSRSGNA